MKRLIALLLVLALITTCLPARSRADMLRLPGNLKEIAESAFEGDGSLDEADVAWGTQVIGSRAFADSGLKRIYIPSTVYHIEDDAFDDGVTILSAPTSGAKRYADRKNLSWEDCEDHYPQEKIISGPEEDWDSETEPLTPDNLAVEAAELLTADGETNADILAHLQEINAMAENANGMIDAYNLSIQNLYDGMESLTSAMDGSTAGTSGSNTVFSLNGIDLALATDMLNGVTVSADETDDYVLASADGSPYTVSFAGDTLQIGPAASQLRMRSPQYPNSWWDRVLDVAEQLWNLYDAVEVMISRGLTNVNKLIRQWEDIARAENTWFSQCAAMDYYREYPDELARITAQRKKVLEWVKRNLDPLISRQRKILGWQKALKAVNIGASIGQLMYLYHQHQVVEEIRGHEHPTDHDNYPEAMDYSELLNKNLDYLDQALAVDAAMTVISVVSMLSAVASAAGCPLVGLALAVAGWATLAVSFSLNGKENELWDKVQEFDEALHCSVIGTVKDKDTDEPLEEVAVHRGTASSADYLVYSNAAGEYEIYVLNTQRSLVFTKAGYKDAVVNLYPFTPFMPEEHDVVMEKEKGCISGVVYNVDTREPIEEARVTCGEDVVLTGADGNFTFEVVPGEYTVTASKKGYVAQSQQVTVEEDQQKVIEFPLVKRRAIHNREELEEIALDVNEDYYLENDIILGNEPWTPLPWFSGSLDGCGYTIYGMSISGPAGGNAGLFQGLYEGEIIDLRMEEARINVTVDSSYTNVGLIAGGINEKSSLKDVRVSGTITVTDGNMGDTNAYVGGFCGFAGDADLENCISAVTITVASQYNVYAGGFAGGVGAGTAKNCESLCGINVSQAGSNSGSNYFVYGTSCYSDEVLENCSVSGGITVRTTNGRANAYGLCFTKHGTNSGPVTAITENGQALAYGCFIGTDNNNTGSVEARATGSGLARAVGMHKITGGTNSGTVQALSVSGNAEAIGAEYAYEDVDNTGDVVAISESGDADATGIFNGTQSMNGGSVSASSISGSVMATGISSGTASRNTGNVTAESDSRDAWASGLSSCSNSANSGDVMAIHTGEAGPAAYVIVYGLNQCRNCVNAGKVEGRTEKTKSDCTAYGVYYNNNNANYGEVEAYSEYGNAVAWGSAYSQSSQNYGNVTARAEAMNASARAIGASAGSSLNEGTVKAVSLQGNAYAYGVGDTTNEIYGNNVSTGEVLAFSNLLSIRTLEDGTKEVKYGHASAYNSEQVSAHVGGYSITSSGQSDLKHMYIMIPSSGCSRHAGREPSVVSGTPSDLNSCSCYHNIADIHSYHFGDYTMPE